MVEHSKTNTFRCFHSHHTVNRRREDNPLPTAEGASSQVDAHQTWNDTSGQGKISNGVAPRDNLLPDLTREREADRCVACPQSPCHKGHNDTGEEFHGV